MSRDLLALVLLCGLTFFAALGRPAITDSDEAFYAEAAREMLESGDWITPHYNYEFRFQKPILFYWLAGGAYLVAGVGEAAARFPSAMAGLGLVLLTYGCARRWFDAATALLAGGIAATSFGYLAMARQALPDMPLAFFVTLATWTAIVALSDETVGAPAAAGAGDRPRRRRWLLTAAAATAAAFLTKGPVGIALPLVVLAPLLLWKHWPRRPSRPEPGRWPTGPRVSDFVLAAIVFVMLAAPWYIAMTVTHGPEYLDRFFIGENLERFATDRFNAPRPLWFYLPIILGGLLPWSPLMLLWVPPLTRLLRGRRRLSFVEARLAIWAVAPLLFYTASVGKQPRYILPILPPLAIVLARAIHTRLRALGAGSEGSVRRRDPLFAVSGAFSGLILVTFGILLYGARPLVPESNPAWLAGAATLIVAAGLVTGAAAVLGRGRLVPLTLVAAAVITMLGLQYTVLSVAGPEPVERIAELLTKQRVDGEPSARYRVFVRNLVFYTHVKQVDPVTDDQLTTFLRSENRVWCVIAKDDLARIERTGIVARQHGEVSYLNTGNLRVATLLRPDPSRDLKTVVLISNR